MNFNNTLQKKIDYDEHFNVKMSRLNLKVAVIMSAVKGITWFEINRRFSGNGDQYFVATFAKSEKFSNAH